MTTRRTPAAPPKETEPRKKRQQVSPRKWAEMEALYEAGDIDAKGIASRLNMSEAYIYERFGKKGIKKGSKAKEMAARVKEEVAKTVVDDSVVLAQRIRETKEEHYKMAQGMAKLTWKEVMLAQQTNQPIADRLGNFKALNQAMQVLKGAREERWAVLGLDQTGGEDMTDLPELVVEELTAQQIEDIQNAQEDPLQFGVSGDIEDIGDDEIDDEGIVEES